MKRGPGLPIKIYRTYHQKYATFASKYEDKGLIFFKTFDLVDMWRQKHPGTPGFTWSNCILENSVQTRLLFFSSRIMQHLITDC